MRRLLATTVLALFALCATASAATPKPTITSFSPPQVAVGGSLVLKGKNFASGASHNRVFFSRASDGKTVRARPSRASKTRIEVVVPASLTKFLTDAKATTFQVSILSKTFGPKTKKSKSPLIFPAGSAPTTPGTTTPGTTPPPPPDCDSDGTPDAQDADDDNDGLPDDLEIKIGTAVCNKDTDGDGIEDGFEYWSAKDLNSNALPYPGKRPYPNPLDPTDAQKDFDQDGLTQADEFAAWVLYGGRVLPTGDGQSFPYSDGNQTSPAVNGTGGTDYDRNGKVTDDEKDADGDGLANWIELSKGSLDSVNSTLAAFGRWTDPNLGKCPDVGLSGGRYQNCGNGPIANGNTFTVGNYPSYYTLNWLDPDTDGDGVNDSNDDQDHDDISNAAEIAAQTNPVNPCDPNVESRTCPQHP